MKHARAAVAIAVLFALVLVAGCGGQTAPKAPAAGSQQPQQQAQQPPQQQADAKPAGPLPTVEIVVFSPPSLGYFLPPVIEEKQFDAQNGVDLKFVQRPTTAYNTEYAAGQHKVGGSAALLSEGLRANKGIKTVFLFNLFDFFGTVVTKDPSIKTLADLTGKSMAAAKSTTNYAMFQYFAQRSGANLSKIDVQNAEPSGLLALMKAGRVAAVQLWEPAYSTLMMQNPGEFHQVDFGLQRWKEFTGGNTIPYLGVAAHQDWIDQNAALIPKMFKAYQDAADWVRKNPEQAAVIIAKANQADEKAIVELIKRNDRLGMNVAPAADLVNDIKAVMKAGVEIGYFDKQPGDTVIYQGKLR